MNSRLLSRFTLALAGLFAMSACESVAPSAPRAPRAELEQQLADEQALVNRYEKRFGKLLPQRPALDFRKVRAQLKGKPASAVVALLGKPLKVFTSGATESWDYTNVAYDPVSGRTVRHLAIWLRNGVVDYMNASF